MATKPPPYDGNRENVNTDRYAAESFTWRRMKRWQIIGIIVALIIFGLLLWALT